MIICCFHFNINTLFAQETVITEFNAYVEPWQIEKIKPGDRIHLLGIFAPGEGTIYSAYRFIQNMKILSLETDKSSEIKPGVPAPCKITGEIPKPYFKSIQNLMTHTDERVYIEWHEKMNLSKMMRTFIGPQDDVIELTEWIRPEKFEDRLRIKILGADSCSMKDKNYSFDDLETQLNGFDNKEQFIEIVVPEKYWFRIFYQVNEIRDRAKKTGFSKIGLTNENKEFYQKLEPLSIN